MPLQSKGGQNSKKQTTKHYKGRFLNTQKILYMYVAIKIPRWFEELQVTLL
jgi:hypothetical protein